MKQRESADEKAFTFLRKTYNSGLKSYYSTIDKQLEDFRNYEKKKQDLNKPEEIARRRISMIQNLMQLNPCSLDCVIKDGDKGPKIEK